MVKNALLPSDPLTLSRSPYAYQPKRFLYHRHFVHESTNLYSHNSLATHRYKRDCTHTMRSLDKHKPVLHAPARSLAVPVFYQ